MLIEVSKVKARKPDKHLALIVGNPTSDPDLIGAENEATAIESALLMKGQEVVPFVRNEANWENVTQTLSLIGARTATEHSESTTYFHFAGHSVFNPVSPDLSSLTLAKGVPGQDAVYSIADAFLKAGATTVVANAWPVNDAVATR